MKTWLKRRQRSSTSYMTGSDFIRSQPRCEQVVSYNLNGNATQPAHTKSLAHELHFLQVVQIKPYPCIATVMKELIMSTQQTCNNTLCQKQGLECSQHKNGLLNPAINKTINAPLSASFSGPEGGVAYVSVAPTPGGSDRRITISLNDASSAKIASISSERLLYGDYEVDPDGYEYDAFQAYNNANIELIQALRYAQTVNPVQIEVRGLPTSLPTPQTPTDGVVVGKNVRSQVFGLVGCIAGAWNLKGFAYASENNKKLLRAVAPVALNAGQASSQGFADDLGWHSDNANRKIPNSSDCHPGDKGPMNQYQAFVAISPKRSIPMETVALADVVDEVIAMYSIEVIDTLLKNEFAIKKPDSHGGGLDIENIPVLAVDSDGKFHSRYHAGNIECLTPEAENALKKFSAVLNQTTSIMEIKGQPASLLMYSNTRCLHRRRQYEAELDGSDRYYIRLYLMAEKMMASHQEYLSERVFT